MSTFAQMIENITPQIYESLKTAVEIGKWSDGRKLTAEQKELSLQAVIAWEMKNLPEEQRTGYMGP
ncbi:YeaC family protein, partial [Klebsiella pneumoniae]|nr:YeaC family protein [Klebsiella pneumoniae]